MHTSSDSAALAASHLGQPLALLHCSDSGRERMSNRSHVLDLGRGSVPLFSCELRQLFHNAGC